MTRLALYQVYHIPQGYRCLELEGKSAWNDMCIGNLLYRFRPFCPP